MVSFISCEAQELVSLDSLLNQVKRLSKAKKESEIIEFNYEMKGKFLNYVPSVGFSFGLPSVNWSLSEILAIRKDKKVRKQKIKSIILKNDNELSKKIEVVKIKYKKLEVEFRKLEQKEGSILICQKIFKIYKEAFEKEEIAPLEFYKQTLAKENVENDLENFKLELKIKILELDEFINN